MDIGLDRSREAIASAGADRIGGAGSQTAPFRRENEEQKRADKRAFGLCSRTKKPIVKEEIDAWTGIEMRSY